MRKKIRIGRRAKRRRVDLKLASHSNSVRVHSGIADCEEVNADVIEDINSVWNVNNLGGIKMEPSPHNIYDAAPVRTSPGVGKFALAGAERQLQNPRDSYSEKSCNPPVTCPEDINCSGGPQADIGKVEVTEFEDNICKEEESLMLPQNPHAVETKEERGTWEKMPCCGSNMTPSQSCPLICECDAFPVHHCVYRCSEAGMMRFNARDLSSKFHLLLNKFQELQKQKGELTSRKERYRKKWLQERRARLQTLVFSKACVKLFSE